MGNARELILNQGKQLKDVVSFRENMLEFLASNGVHADDAFKFAEIVRKGKQVKDKEKFEPLVAKLLEKGVPD
jgi:DNA polymerase III alpha subunit (gram-positive type)